MSMTAKKPEKPPQIPAGNYPAVCYSAIDLGVQYNEHFGKSAKRAMLTWEIPAETIEIDGEEKRRVISKEYTISLHEKSNLTKDLISWRGRAFTKEEEDGFSLFNVVGVSCLLQIVHNDKGYANVAAVAGLVKGMPPIEPENPIVKFDIDEGLNIPDGIPDWIKDKINNSLEVRSAKGLKSNPDITGEDTTDHPDVLPDDDIPF